MAEYSGNLPFQAPEILASVTRACLCLYCVLSEWWCYSWALGASVQLTHRLQQLVTLRISSTDQWTVEPGLICIKRYACISPEKVSDLVFCSMQIKYYFSQPCWNTTWVLASHSWKWIHGAGIVFVSSILKCVWYFGSLCVFQLLCNVFHTVAVFEGSSSITTSPGIMYLSTVQ